MAKSTNEIWSADSDWDTLLKIATPKLYHVNAFRVLGLPINITLREIDRHRKKLEMIKKLGVDSHDQNKGSLPLATPSDDDTMRHATEHLRDPEKRFIDI